jgi:hypothetical protein
MEKTTAKSLQSALRNLWLFTFIVTSSDVFRDVKIGEHVAMLHNAAQQLHSRLTFADPVLKDSVAISKQISHNEVELLGCVDF